MESHVPSASPSIAFLNGAALPPASMVLISIAIVCSDRVAAGNNLPFHMGFWVCGKIERNRKVDCLAGGETSHFSRGRADCSQD